MPTIRERLENEILPYVAAAESMGSRWDFRCARWFKVLQALGAAMVAAGVGLPFLPAGDAPGVHAALVPNVSGPATGLLALGGTVLTVAMIVVRDWMQSDETQLRLVRMKACIRSGAEAEFDLREALQLDDPRPRLTEIQSKVRAQVRDCVTCGVPVVLNSPDVLQRLKRKLDALPKFNDPGRAEDGEQRPKQ